MAYTDSFPRQQLPLTRKNTAWRRQCMDWADSRSAFRWSPVRKSVMKMKINYDLLDGRLHMGDVKAFVNPDGIDADYIPDGIQHYPIMNSKLDLLRGEEGHRQYDWRAVVTNPVAVSEAEEAKQRALLADLSSLVQDTSLGEQSFGGELDRLADSPSGFWYGTVDSLEDTCPELCWRLRGDSAERFAMVLMTTPSGAPYAALGLEYNPGTEARDTAEVFAAMLRCSLAAGMVLNAGK